MFMNDGEDVHFSATVDAVRLVPAGKPLPGLHLDMKVNGQPLDVYIAPADFCTKFDIKVVKGDEVRIVGIPTLIQPEQPEVVLGREITIGTRNPISGQFRPTLTVYLRGDDGPFWLDPQPVAGPRR